MEEKEPVPVPFDVFVDKVIVGLVVVDQTTPLAVMDAPPSAVILPPVVDEVVVIADIAVVVSEGMETIEFESFRQRTEIPADLVPLSKSSFLSTLSLPIVSNRNQTSVEHQKNA